MKKKYAPPSDAKLLRDFFSTDDLIGTFGTDDPVEILSAINFENIVDDHAQSKGWEREDREFREIVEWAKKTKARRDKLRRAGSLEFLAEKLSKTSKQIRNYCAKGLVPGAYRTKGGHWRVRYEEDTVERTRAAIGSSSRSRTAGWLLKRLRMEWEHEPPPAYPDELCYPEKRLSGLRYVECRCLEAARNLLDREQKVTAVEVARMTGFSRTTVQKYASFFVKQARIIPFANDPLLDQRIDVINQREDGKLRTLNREFDEDE